MIRVGLEVKEKLDILAFVSGKVIKVVKYQQTTATTAAAALDSSSYQWGHVYCMTAITQPPPPQQQE